MFKIFLSWLLLISCVQSFASEFKMVGTYLLEYSIFKIDVYQITYFKNQDSEKLELNYKVDVKKEHSIEGWKVGLKHKLEDQIYAEKAKWLFDNTLDMSSGDLFSIVKKKDSIEFYKNNKMIAKISDNKVAELAFEPWLGTMPVSDELKRALLGEKI